MEHDEHDDEKVKDDVKDDVMITCGRIVKLVGNDGKSMATDGNDDMMNLKYDGK